MRKYVRSIRVEDASGAQFDVHEFVTTGWLRKCRLFELETGEPARRVDDHCFALVSTGEPLVRLDGPSFCGESGPFDMTTPE